MSSPQNYAFVYVQWIEFLRKTKNKIWLLALAMRNCVSRFKFINFNIGVNNKLFRESPISEIILSSVNGSILRWRCVIQIINLIIIVCCPLLYILVLSQFIDFLDRSRNTLHNFQQLITVEFLYCYIIRNTLSKFHVIVISVVSV